MKKFLVVFLTLSFFISCGYAMTVEQKTNEVSKKDWQEYQKYKKEESKKVKVSDTEYAEYQQYLKNKQETEKENAVKNNEEKKEIQTVSKKENKENEIIIKGGKILKSSIKTKAKNSYTGVSATETETNSDGWVLKGDYIHYLAENTGIGLGISYHSEFKANDNSFLNIDLLLKQRFPLKKENIGLYLMGGLGYGILTGTNKQYVDSEYYVKYDGGIHWMLAFGIDINSFIIDLSYSCNYIDIKTNIPYVSGEGSFCSVILSVGYKFSF